MYNEDFNYIKLLIQSNFFEQFFVILIFFLIFLSIDCSLLLEQNKLTLMDWPRLLDYYTVKINHLIAWYILVIHSQKMIVLCLVINFLELKIFLLYMIKHYCILLSLFVLFVLHGLSLQNGFNNFYNNNT